MLAKDRYELEVHYRHTLGDREAFVSSNLQCATRLRQAVLQKAFTGEL